MENDNDMDNEMDQFGNSSHSAGGSAPVKRKRLTQACDPCRKKKIKCDGNKPSCGNCAKLDIQCTYLPSMKKRGPRQGYIELLEKRLDKMEKMLQNGPGVVDQESLDTTVAKDENDPNEPAFTRPDKPDSRYFGNTSAFSHYNDSDRVISVAASCPTVTRQEQSKALIRNKKPLYGLKGEVPRKDVLDHLIQLFFDSVYYQLPIIHPGSFMIQYKEGKVSPNLLNAICAAVARFSTHADVVTIPAFLAGEPFAANVRSALVDSIDIPTVATVQALLLLAMYEYGAARGPRAWMFGGMAIRMAHELGLNREDSSPVFYLKGDWVMRETRRRTFWGCFIMDVLASSSSGRPRMMDERDCEVLLPSEDKAWHEARPVISEMLDGGEGPDSSTDSPKEENAGVNTKSNKTASQRSESSHATANTSDQNLKETQKSNRGEGNQKSPRLSSFAYLIRILGILGKVSQYVNRPQTKKYIPPNEHGSEFSILDAALAGWLRSIPPDFKYSPANSDMLKEKREGCIVIFMYVVYHTSVVLLHRPILAADKTSFPMNPSFVESSVTRCAEAASKVSEVLDFVTVQNFPPSVYVSSFFAYPVFTTATIHITNAFAPDPALASKARRNLSTHVKILQTMKNYWAMADKFFYIIRDLYSIQSKISSSASSGGIIVPQVVSHNPHGCSRNYQADSAVHALKAKEDPRIRDTKEKDDERTRQRLEGEHAESRMVVEGKLASISSFLKSDSGLIALWRRATEMQVIDEANQLKRRIVSTDEPSKTQQIMHQYGNGGKTDDLELQEQRDRANQLEIQEINREFERQCKAKLLEEGQQRLQSNGQDESQRGLNTSDSQTLEKRASESDEHSILRASKQPRVTLDTTAGSQPPTGSASWQGSEQNMGISSTSNLAYRHSMLQQPEQFKQLQGQEAYILQPMLVQAAAPAAQSNANQQLMNVYSQQHQQQGAPSQTINFSQNATTQHQGQQAPTPSSLTFGSPTGFSSGFSPSNSVAEQQNRLNNFQTNTQDQHQQNQQMDLLNGPIFGPPLAYGSSYSQTQSSKAQAELTNSIFDFAMPLGDLNFLSSSFQMTPTMKQQQNNGVFDSMNNLTTDNSYNNDARPSASLSPVASLSSPNTQPPSQRVGPGPLTSDSASSPLIASPAQSTISSSSILMSSLDTPDLSSATSIQGRNPSDPMSPTATTNNISPSLHSFMMSDDAFAEMQSTPDSLIRYLQLHHQRQIQQELQLQQPDMQPVLNQQNSLIYDNYFLWSQLLPNSGSVPATLQQQHQQLQQQSHLQHYLSQQQQQQQQQQQPQQPQQQQKQFEHQPISPMNIKMDDLLNGDPIHTAFPSYS
ncbi:hypothetical protein BGZ80_007601 [Entomortierella chlamydospora]|uniref:Zn(2)-C6 fungal-type domain-containing protein n=1 Tax=Entomortierella chlamydospora TaxID=101097 RepID=A0A9P6T1N0_9FUNG|nr:hypothetical protein BGZ79_000933 [Entomortierella chlamydospora]KAG0018061.1 hypothetical protein BGZ80_007601 [Entomortierella chlamydospora]